MVEEIRRKRFGRDASSGPQMGREGRLPVKTGLESTRSTTWEVWGAGMDDGLRLKFCSYDAQ